MLDQVSVVFLHICVTKTGVKGDPCSSLIKYFRKCFVLFLPKDVIDYTQHSDFL